MLPLLRRNPDFARRYGVGRVEIPFEVRFHTVVAGRDEDAAICDRIIGHYAVAHGLSEPGRDVKGLFIG